MGSSEFTFIDVVRTPSSDLECGQVFTITFKVIGDEEAVIGFCFPFDNNSLTRDRLEFQSFSSDPE